MEYLRRCAGCGTIYGCYNPAKRNCALCSAEHCPFTDDATHGLCDACLKEAFETDPLLACIPGGISTPY